MSGVKYFYWVNPVVYITIHRSHTREIYSIPSNANISTPSCGVMVKKFGIELWDILIR